MPHLDNPKKITITLSSKVINAIARAYDTRLSEAISAFVCFDKAEIERRLVRVERVRRCFARRLALSSEENDQQVLFASSFLARAVEHYLSCLIALKESRGHDAWLDLVDTQSHLSRATSMFMSESALNIIREFSARLGDIDEYCFPGLQFQSMAYEIIKDECSICQQPMLACDHDIGGLYGGKLCQRIIITAKPIEFSLVDSPRNRKAVVQSYTENGYECNVFDGTRSSIARSRHSGRSDPNAFTISGYGMTYSVSSDPSEWESLRQARNG